MGDEPVLPTPRAQDSYERSNRKTVARAMRGEAQMTLTRFIRGRTDTEVIRMVDEADTSASSAASGDSTSRSKRSTATNPQPSSSGTQPVSESSPPTGPMSPSSETSPGSEPLLLPTPTSQAAKHGAPTPFEVARQGTVWSNGNLWEAVAMLPTPRTTDGTDAPANRSEYLDRVVSGEDGRTPRLSEMALYWTDGSTSSAGASPASQPPTPGSGREPTTTAGSGPSSPVWLASYDPATSSWRTSQVSLLSTEDERFPRSSETWPRSGMTRRGEAFALPMSAHPTAGSGSSSSLNVPTPTASDAIWADRGHSRRGIVGNHNLGLVDWARMLPTPTANEDSYRIGGDSQQSKSLSGMARRGELGTLPPTPRARDHGTQGDYTTGEGGPNLGETVRSLGEPTNPPSEGGNE